MQYVIGIDLGGTEIKGAIVSTEGNIITTHKQKTDISMGRTSILTTLDTVISELLNTKYNISAIGIGSAGRINPQTGEVVFATDNLPGWTGLNLKGHIEAKFNMPIKVDNDANVALIGEAFNGAGKDFNNIVMLTLGTGVGGANFINGEIMHGKNFSAGEWGHVVLYPNGKECNCGNKGCIEQYISGTALFKNGVELGLNIQHGSEIYNYLTPEHLDVVAMFEKYIDDLVHVITNVNNSLDPELIIIGGGVINSQDRWWNQFLEPRLKNKPFIKCFVKPAILGNKAGIIGAAKLAIEVITVEGEDDGK